MTLLSAARPNPMPYRAIYFDFGFVLAFPKAPMDPKYYYLDWDRIPDALRDPQVKAVLGEAVTPDSLASCLQTDVVDVFKEHENTDLISPDIIACFQKALNRTASVSVNADTAMKVITHLNTMHRFCIGPATKEVLSRIRAKGLTISLISNMMLPGVLLRDKLKAEGIADLFSTISISSEVGYIKPHKSIFLLTLEKDGLRPSGALFVGDTYKQDILGASAVGMDTVWYNSRNETRDTAMNRHTYLVASLTELERFLGGRG
jgi:FMN phosphatase YigB (HAD superfamily)